MNREELPSELHWAELHLDALVRCDAAGRMVASNDVAGSTSAPLFFYAATAHGNLWRVRAGLPDGLTRELCRLAAAERTGSDLDADPERLPAIEERIRGELEIERDLQVFRGQAFRMPTLLGSEPAPGTELLAPGEEAELEAAFPRLAGTAVSRRPCVVLREEGRIVSACHAATVLGPRGGVEAGVDTLASHRRRGFGSRVVAAWADAVRRSGAVPLYSASRTNRASMALACSLGLVPYAATLHLS